MKSVLITSSILILVIAALRPVLRGRFKPQIQYALWGVAALRLLVPGNLAAPSAHSALALANRVEAETHLAESIGRASVPLPVQSYDDAYDQALQEYVRNERDSDALQYDEMQAKLAARARELQAKGPTVAQLAADYARPVWLAGAVLTAVWFLLVNVRLRRKLRTAVPVEADCPLPVRVTPELPSPCLLGVLHPVIYVTPDALADPDRERHVLVHEMTHCRHKDHWWALIRCLCLCVYWFDPLVWWAAAMSRQDCELACDAGAIRCLGEEERIPYGRTLVAMIAAGRNSLLQTATTMTGTRRWVRERVELIARRPKTTIALTLAAALLVGLAVGCTFTGAPEDPPKDSSGAAGSVEPTEPEPPSSDGLNTATLPERLGTVPGELWADVDALAASDPTVLAEYWMHRPWTDHPSGMGWLMSICRWSEAEYTEKFVGKDASGIAPFARSGDSYYVTLFPTDVRWPITQLMDDPMNETLDYKEKFASIRDYAEQTVLDTEGVEPFTPEPDVYVPEYDVPPRVKGNIDRTMMTSPMEVSDDPETWYLVGQVPGQPIWMFSRDHGNYTMFQLGNQLTQEFPYGAHNAGYWTYMPRLVQLKTDSEREGYGTVAVISHRFQGGLDRIYQLVVYDFEPKTGPVAYVHDWESLMDDFNENRSVRYDPINHTAIIVYQRQHIEIDLDETDWYEGDDWDYVSHNGIQPSVYEYDMGYFFNDNGTATLEMPVLASNGGLTTPYTALWTIRFTGSGFETADFRFEKDLPRAPDGAVDD